MIGYWKGGRRPITTTGNNFMENFVFLTPNFGTLMFVLLIGIPIAFIYNIVSPTNTYKFSDYHNYLKITYQTSGDEVTGTIEKIWDDNDNNYHIDTNFKGKINGNTLTVELESPSVRKDVGGPAWDLNKMVTLTVNNNKIYFDGIEAEKI